MFCFLFYINKPRCQHKLRTAHSILDGILSHTIPIPNLYPSGFTGVYDALQAHQQIVKGFFPNIAKNPFSRGNSKDFKHVVKCQCPEPKPVQRFLLWQAIKGK